MGKIQTSRALLVSCAQTTVSLALLVSNAAAQTNATETTPPPPASASGCTPECAPGFECSQGFCVAVESQTPRESAASIDAPGLALGAQPASVSSTPTKTNRAKLNAAKTRPSPPSSEDEGDEDGDVDERPKSEDVQDWSDYRHQGFYLRLGAGLALAWVDGRTPFLENVGIERSDAEVTFEGEFSIGGTVGPVAFGYRGIVNPDITAFTGAFVDVYPDPLDGLHIEASAGLGGIGTEDFAGTLGVGHDFFFAREWSVGVTVRALRTFGSVTISTVSINASILCH